METYKNMIDQVFWSFLLEAVLAVIAGICIFIYPDILGFIVGIFLIIVGLKGVFFAFKLKNILNG